jgi:hypothetical protein
MLRNGVAEAVNIPEAMRRSGSNDGGSELSRGEGDDSANYLFELLVAARRLAVTRRHRFLAYLIGMAAEEARLLSQGRSAVGQ